MIHRAILGSLERFMGILIENFAGAGLWCICPTGVRCPRSRCRHLCMRSQRLSVLPQRGAAQPALTPALSPALRRSLPVQAPSPCGWRPCSAGWCL